MNVVMRKPSAWFPVAMSIIVLASMVIYIATHGTPTREPDEGIGAHLFQIWLVLEVLTIGFFAIKWLPKEPRHAFVILLIQIIAVLAACSPVYYYRL